MGTDTPPPPPTHTHKDRSCCIGGMLLERKSAHHSSTALAKQPSPAGHIPAAVHLQQPCWGRCLPDPPAAAAGVAWVQAISEKQQETRRQNMHCSGEGEGGVGRQGGRAEAARGKET